MAKYTLAVAILVGLATSGDAFSPRSVVLQASAGYSTPLKRSEVRRHVSPALNFPDDKGIDLKAALVGATDSLSEAISTDDDEEETAIALKRKSVQARTTGLYDVRFSLVDSKSVTVNDSIGVTLCQFENGARTSQLDLTMDTLQFDRPLRSSDETTDVWNLPDVDASLKGIVVSSVKIGSQGWEAGVRSGDILTASSATVGTVSL